MFPTLTAKHGARGTVIDLDTGLEVRRTIGFEPGSVVKKDGEGNYIVTGILQAYEVDVFGKIKKTSDSSYKKYRAKGQFKFIPQTGPTPKITLGAERCVTCSSALTLPGEELCPVCMAAYKNQKHRMRVETIANPLLDHPCEAKYCGQLASIMVSDEVIVSPSSQRRRLDPERTHSRSHWLHYERGMTVARHFYCARHHQPPRILDAKGEVIEVLEPALV